MSRRWTAKEIVARISAREARFVLAGSRNRPKSYATLKRHARGASGRALTILFGAVTENRRRRAPRYVLNDLGSKVKLLLGGRV